MSRFRRTRTITVVSLASSLLMGCFQTYSIDPNARAANGLKTCDFSSFQEFEASLTQKNEGSECNFPNGFRNPLKPEEDPNDPRYRIEPLPRQIVPGEKRADTGKQKKSADASLRTGMPLRLTPAQ